MYIKAIITIFIIIVILTTTIIVYNIVKFAQSETRIIERKSKQGDYSVFEILNLLSPKECDYVIEKAKEKGLSDSMVWSYVDEKGNDLDEKHRKSKQTWLSDDEIDVAMKLSNISTYLTNIPKENQELLQVAMYETFGKFNAHYDACAYSDVNVCNKMNKNAGQRRTTLIVYLNDNFIGGETEFTKADILVKPKKGKGLLFWDTDSEEKILDLSEHRGNEVRGGQKWICTKWSHARAYKDVM